MPKKEEPIKTVTATAVVLNKPTLTAGGSLTKVIPKQFTATSAIKTTTPSGQIVFIQSPGGTAQPIRIAGTSATTPSGTGSGIQLIKTADGNFIQLKNKSSISLTPASVSAIQKATPVANANNALGRIIVKRTNGQRLLISTPPSSNTTTTTITEKTQTTTTAPSTIISPTKTTRTVTVAQAKKMGLLTSTNLKELVTGQKQGSIKIQTSTPGVTKITTATPSTVLTNAKIVKPALASTSTTTASAPTQKVLIQVSGGIQKQVMLPQHLVKLAQSGQIKAVNVPGKGIQYVRINTASSNSSTNISTTTSNTMTMVSKIVTTKSTSANGATTTTTASISSNQSNMQQKPATQTFTIVQPTNNDGKSHVTTIGGTTIKQHVCHLQIYLTLHYYIVFFFIRLSHN